MRPAQCIHVVRPLVVHGEVIGVLHLKPCIETIDQNLLHTLEKLARQIACKDLAAVDLRHVEVDDRGTRPCLIDLGRCNCDILSDRRPAYRKWHGKRDVGRYAVYQERRRHHSTRRIGRYLIAKRR